MIKIKKKMFAREDNVFLANEGTWLSNKKWMVKIERTTMEELSEKLSRYVVEIKAMTQNALDLTRVPSNVCMWQKTKLLIDRGDNLITRLYTNTINIAGINQGYIDTLNIPAELWGTTNMSAFFNTSAQDDVSLVVMPVSLAQISKTARKALLEYCNEEIGE